MRGETDQQRRSATRVLTFAAAFFTSFTLGLAADRPSPPLELHIEGTKVLNSEGEEVLLRGVNVPSLEWNATGEGRVLETVRIAIDDWNSNVVRIPLAQDRWFGHAPEQSGDGDAYRNIVDEIVKLGSDRGVYVILDLHWSNAGQWGQNIGQHHMPDQHSLAFWKDVAARYKNNPAVIFDLFNETHGVSWDVWYSGGEVTEAPPRGRGGRRLTEPMKYESVPLPELLKAVRETGAKNMVIIGGLNWAYDLDEFLKRPIEDPNGNGVLYANHTYPFKGDTVEEWIAKMKIATEKLPVIVSEFGAETREGVHINNSGSTDEEWVQAVLKACDENNWHYTAWNLHAGATPRLIKDWSYEPTEFFGVFVRENLASGKGKP